MESSEPFLPGMTEDDTAASARKRIRLAEIEELTPRNSASFDIALENARIEASLPELIWDRALILEDIIVQTLYEPRRKLDHQYRFLRRYFLSDTGTTDLVPDFVSECEDLPSVWRYLDRMGVTIEEQAEHVGDAFKELTSFMDLVFRPGRVDYDREPWPGKPIATPFAATPLASKASTSVNSSFWTGQSDPVLQAKRVLSLAPLAIVTLERLIEAAEQARSNNAPPERLEPPELADLRELHRELGALIAAAKRGADLDHRLAAVKTAFSKAFRMLHRTGELVVADVPPLAAAMVPTWATYGICATLLDLSEGSSATLAAGALAASGAIQASRVKGTKQSAVDGPAS